MRSILIVAAGLLQLASASVLPRADSLPIKEPAGRTGAVFAADNLPTLYYNGGLDVTNRTFSFEYKETDRHVTYFDGPGVEYNLAAVPSELSVSLYGPAEQVDGVLAHKKIGSIDLSHDKNPTGLGSHLTALGRLSDGRQIPDGTYHVGIVAMNNIGERDEWLSPVFNVQLQSTSEN